MKFPYFLNLERFIFSLPINQLLSNILQFLLDFHTLMSYSMDEHVVDRNSFFHDFYLKEVVRGHAVEMIFD